MREKISQIFKKLIPTSMKKAILFVILISSVLINLIFFTVDILPIWKQKLERRQMISAVNETDFDLLEKQIIDASLAMAKSDKHIMPFQEQGHFLEEINKLKKKSENIHAWFDHPKGLLYSGLTSYAMAKKDTALMQEIAKNFDSQVINNWEEIKGMVIVDQIPFGVTAMYLYQFFGENKFKQIADELYQITKLLISSDYETPLIFYRKNQSEKLYIVDTLGMICPFLIIYGNLFQEEDAIHLAFEQLQYYTAYGLDKDSFLPAHAIFQTNKIKVGPHNWGRGIGWYFFPMSEYHKYVDNQAFDRELAGLMESLNVLKTEAGTWNQFLGTSNKFDASPTVMYMYGFNNIKPSTYSREDIFNLLKPHIYNGIIGPTSGGAFSVNNYSRTFGQSELTQGIFLMLLSTVSQPN